MQPTYLGWVGFFDMLDQADVFVLLDTVAVSPKSWQTRNRILARDGNVVWLTVPTHAHQGQLLGEVEIDNSKPWQKKHWRTIRSAYEHAPHWGDIEDWLAEGYEECRWDRLTDLSAYYISVIGTYLGLDPNLRRASTLGSTRAGKVERIIDICRAVDADTLLDTPGAQQFLTEPMLEPIRIDWHRYQPAHYSQGDKPWHPYLSVIDLIAWHGTDALSIIRQGRTAATPTSAMGSE